MGIISYVEIEKPKKCSSMVEDRKGASNHTIYGNFEMISWNGLVLAGRWEIILKCGRMDPGVNCEAVFVLKI